MEMAVEEQRLVMFPGLQQLETWQEQQDAAGRRTAAPSGSWSPAKLPYKVHERDDCISDNSEDSDSDGDEAPEGGSSRSRSPPQAAAAAEPDAAEHGRPRPAVVADADVEGLEVGVEEVGFTYRGPEPTLHGDWAHKGRVTDF